MQCEKYLKSYIVECEMCFRVSGQTLFPWETLIFMEILWYDELYNVALSNSYVNIPCKRRKYFKRNK